MPTSPPPPPQIDYALSSDPAKAQKEIVDLFDACMTAANKADVLAVFVQHSWSSGEEGHPGPSTYYFVSPSGLGLHFSLRYRRGAVMFCVSSQPKNAK